VFWIQGLFFCWICDSPFLFLVFSSSLQSLFGEDCVFFASDYPHERARADFLPDIPGLAAREDVSASAKRKIFSENAKRFYGIA